MTLKDHNLKQEIHMLQNTFMYVLLQIALSDLGVRVLVVSFGVHEGARLWLKDTGCPFTMVLDQDRKVITSTM